MHEPTEPQMVVEQLPGGHPAGSRVWSYRQRRKEMLLALLDNHADDLDNAVEELGKWVDHLRHAGIRGFIAEHTWDDDFTRTDHPSAAILDETTPDGTPDDTASADTGDDANSGRATRRRTARGDR